MAIFNQYNTLSEFDIVAKYTKESGFGTDIIAGLQSIKQNILLLIMLDWLTLVCMG
jgi:hypothetical protein